MNWQILVLTWSGVWSGLGLAGGLGEGGVKGGVERGSSIADAGMGVEI